MNFNKYQHVERFGTTEVDNIEAGICYIFPKIDGTNASIWLGDDNEIHCGSRKRELSLENDNAGFFNEMIHHQNIKDYLLKHPTHRLFGEWLVPHTIKTYRDDAWRKFYVFDVAIDNIKFDGGNEYIPYEVYKPLLEEFNIEYLAPLRIIKNGDFDSFLRCVEENRFLIKDGEGVGEGIVIKNYDFYNKYGRQTWAKIVRNEFKEKHFKAMGSPETSHTLVEEKIVEDFVTESLVEKEFNKIRVECDGWSSKYIPRLLNTVYHELICEDMWNIIKKFKNPKIDFKMLHAFTIHKVKKIKQDIFS